MSKRMAASAGRVLLGGVLYLFFLSGMASADQVQLNDFLDRVEEKAATVSSFRCNFIQERHLSIFPEPVIFSGSLSLERPDRLRWEFTEPIPSVLILNGSSGAKCEPSGKKIRFSLDSDPVMRLVARQLWSWTSGSYREMGDEFAMAFSAGPLLSMTPVKGGAAVFISRIQVRFDPETLQPVRVSIMEPAGDRTELFFSAYQLNLQLPPATFSECPVEKERTQIKQ
ncbi:MAG: outer membrane lipoprotein carrier protein LolA [Proteobacteria bacterium]|nr:outer membrane lipoprotein carrier protein LolA [Pseudomonadota bacterium]MBU1739152.1 outer membrane lipoprotein carrier protein LolA [Pseudomonadota bacterium]